MCWELNMDPLEIQVLLTTVSSSPEHSNCFLRWDFSLNLQLAKSPRLDEKQAPGLAILPHSQCWDNRHLALYPGFFTCFLGIKHGSSVHCLLCSCLNGNRKDQLAVSIWGNQSNLREAETKYKTLF